MNDSYGGIAVNDEELRRTMVNCGLRCSEGNALKDGTEGRLTHVCSEAKENKGLD